MIQQAPRRRRPRKPRKTLDQQLDEVLAPFEAAKAYARAENNKAALRGLATFEAGYLMNLRASRSQQKGRRP